MEQLIEWRPALEVGHVMIDSDHKVLVGMLNTLLEGLIAGRGEDVLAQILNGLVDYARMHFSREEKEMLARNYPDMVQHLFEHAQFIREIDGYLAKFRAGDASLSLSLAQYLRDWLIGHIMNTDKKLAEFLTS